MICNSYFYFCPDLQLLFFPAQGFPIRVNRILNTRQLHHTYAMYLTKIRNGSLANTKRVHQTTQKATNWLLPGVI